MIIRPAVVIPPNPPTFVARTNVISHAYDHMMETHSVRKWKLDWWKFVSVNGRWIGEKNHSVTVGALEI